MEPKFIKESYNNNPSITIYDDSKFSQKWLCSSPWFINCSEPAWKWGDNPKLHIDNEEIDIIFDSAVETHVVFQSASLRDEIFQWLDENNFEDPAYWAKRVIPIRNKLSSSEISEIKNALNELKEWVNSYNSYYVDYSMNSVDLTLVGYDYKSFPEGDLWPNPLFDDLLEKHADELDTNDLINIIQSLFNENEDFMDCKATFTAIKLLLKDQTPENEFIVIDSTLRALDGYEPGHRYYEKSLLDRLLDDIFPTFSVEPLLKLLENAHPDNLSKNGDDFVSLAHIALDKNPDENQRKRLDDIVSNTCGS